MPKTRTTSTLIRNAISAYNDAGFEIGAIDLMAGGVVRILRKDALRAQSTGDGENSCDALFSGELD